MRLRTYFGALFVLFVAVALAGVLYVHNQSSRDARRQALQEASLVAGSASNVIAGDARTLTTALGGLQGNPAAVRQLLSQPGKCTLTFDHFGVIAGGHTDILRPNGAVACSSLSRRGYGYGGQSWLARARTAPVMLAPVHDPATGRPVALFTVPVPGAIVAAFVDLRALGPALAAQMGGPHGAPRYLVTSPDGRVLLARSHDPAPWVGRSIVDTAFYRAQDPAQRPDLAGVPHLFARSTVSGLGWRVYAGIDRHVALAAASHLYHGYLVIILAALAVVLAAAAVIQRRIARPIARLGAAVRAGDAGAGLAAIRGPAEVMELADSFGGLSATVEQELASRRRAEVQARATADAYRLLFENNPQPMWIYDEGTLEIFEVNQAAVTAYGYTRDEFLAMTIRELRPPEDVPAMLQSVASAGPRDRSGPWRHRKRDGTIIEVEIVSQVVDFRGRQGRFVMGTDVTERERLQRQLAGVQRLESLGQLAGGVAHDFNNLLAVILNYGAFVDEEVQAAAGEDAARWATVRADVVQIQEAARRAARLTHQLLAFARREVIHPEVLDVNVVVRGTEELLRRTLGEHIELTFPPSGELPPVLADAGQLEQVLVNLAVNARDAMPDGGTLIVETAEIDVDESYASSRPGLTPGRYVRLRVSDTGQGMDPQTVERAFEPFFTTKPKGEGTGLGLATIYGIVTQMGGRVSLYSERGIGTTCTVLLPATDRPAAAAGEPASDERGGSGEIVLLVEDEAGIREVARRILHRRGYEVLTAADGAHAVELARGHDGPIDLLLTDVIMPGMMGRDVAERVLALRPDTRVLFMSGYAHPVLGSRDALPAGTALIEKPFSEPELLAKVREALAAGGAPAGAGTASGRGSA